MICLDPGHGYKGAQHTGAAANSLVEDDVALYFCIRLGHYLRRAGCQTVLTRDKGFVELGSRGALAVDTKCKLFVSVHCNAASSTAARGVEAFHAPGDFAGKRIAQSICEALMQGGAKFRSVKVDSQSQYSSLRVLRDTYRHMPACLVELGFLTNKLDAAMLADKFWIEKQACRVARVLAS